MLSAKWPFVFCALAVGGALVPSFCSPTVSVDSTSSQASIVARNLTGAVTVVLAPPAPHIGHFYEYFDPKYARGRAMSDRFAFGFPGHLRDALDERRYGARIERVDAAGLADIFHQDPRGSCVFVPGGFLPARLHLGRQNAMRRWIFRGGVVFWAGSPFDAYYSAAGTTLSPGDVLGPDTSAWPSLYSRRGPLRTVRNIHSPELAFGSIGTPDGAALGITFDATTFPVNGAALYSQGGTAIGYLDDSGNSSVSVLTAGKGRIIIFGDAIDDEQSAAEEIAQIVASGAWFEPRAIHLITKMGPGNARLTIALQKNMRVYAFGDPPYYSPFGN